MSNRKFQKKIGAFVAFFTEVSNTLRLRVLASEKKFQEKLET
ncbi:hypothetical protein [Flavobacterium ichthyis]|nr:hypothetical protein [Flavobacterium ichthyis]